MIKKVLVMLSVMVLFLFSSCTNIAEGNDATKGGNVSNGGGCKYEENGLVFAVGTEASDKISVTIKANKEITDDTELKLNCKLNRGNVTQSKLEQTVLLKNLPNATFKFNEVPFGKGYSVKLEISYKNTVIYTAASSNIDLTPNEDVTVDLLLTQKNSRINYHLNDGQFKPEIKDTLPLSYFLDSDITLPNPEKEGFNFDGWYSSNSYRSEEIVTGLGASKFLGNVDLYAKWTSIEQVQDVKDPSGSYKIDVGDKIALETDTMGADIYYTTDGTEPTKNSLQYNVVDQIEITEDMLTDDTVCIKAIAIKDGMINSSLFNVTYTRNKYKVSFKVKLYYENYLNISEVSLKKGEKATQPVINSDDFKYLDILGWYTKDSCEAGTEWNFDSTVDKPITLYAKVRSKLVITPEGDTIDVGDEITITGYDSDVNINYNTTLNSVPEVSYDSRRYSPLSISCWDKKGDDFVVNAIGGRSYFVDSEVFTKIYKVNKYNITYNSNGKECTLPSDKTKVVNGTKVEGTELNVTGVSCLGYKLDHWTDQDGNIIPVNGPTVVNKKDLVLTAQWKDIPPSAIRKFDVLPGKTEATLVLDTPADKDLAKIVITGDGLPDGGVEIDVKPNEHKEHTVTNLKENTSYTFTATLYDAGGNAELASHSCTFKTVTTSFTPTETPVLFTDYTPAHAPTGGTPTGTDSLSWQYVKFGDYPQSRFTGDVTKLIRCKNINQWDNCYTDGNGNYYVKVEADYRSSGSKFIDGTAVVRDNEYFFKLEPIIWRVISNTYLGSDGNYTQDKLLLAENVLDDCYFFYGSTTRNITGESDPVKENNYKYSGIRAYLNGTDFPSSSTENSTMYNNKGFLQKAFTTQAIGSIKDTRVPDEDDTHVYDTVDKIFLLSNSEGNKTDYGFSANDNRKKKVTDYAIAVGADADETTKTGKYWLRTPGNSDSYSYIVTFDGSYDYYSSCSVSYAYGVVPALTLPQSLIK